MGEQSPLRLRPLAAETVSDILCAPGGAEYRRARIDELFSDQVETIVRERRTLMERGMIGAVAYRGETPVGFVEAMPVDIASVGISAPAAWLLGCLHVRDERGDQAEAKVESVLMRNVLDGLPADASGLVAIGWDHDTHWPRENFEGYGFDVVDSSEVGGMTRYLMWYSLRDCAQAPRLVEAADEAVPGADGGQNDRGGKDYWIVVQYSGICPFSIRARQRIEEAFADACPAVDIIFEDASYQITLVSGEIALIQVRGRWYGYGELDKALEAMREG